MVLFYFILLNSISFHSTQLSSVQSNSIQFNANYQDTKRFQSDDSKSWWQYEDDWMIIMMIWFQFNSSQVHSGPLNNTISSTPQPLFYLFAFLFRIFLFNFFLFSFFYLESFYFQIISHWFHIHSSNKTFNSLLTRSQSNQWTTPSAISIITSPNHFTHSLCNTFNRSLTRF